MESSNDGNGQRLDESGSGTEERVIDIPVDSFGGSQQSEPDGFFAGFGSSNPQDGSGTGTEGKRRGRRRNPGESDSSSGDPSPDGTQSIPVVSVKSTTGRRRTVKAGTVTDAQIGTAIASFCGLLSMIRGEHWLVSEEDATQALGKPLCDLLASQSPKTVKAVSQALLPLALVSGALILFGPAIQAETAIINEKLNTGKNARAQRITPVPQPREASVNGSVNNHYEVGRTSPTDDQFSTYGAGFEDSHLSNLRGGLD